MEGEELEDWHLFLFLFFFVEWIEVFFDLQAKKRGMKKRVLGNGGIILSSFQMLVLEG